LEKKENIEEVMISNENQDMTNVQATREQAQGIEKGIKVQLDLQVAELNKKYKDLEVQLMNA